MSPRNARNDRHRPPEAPWPPRRAPLPVRLWRWRTEIVLAAVVATVAALAAAGLREDRWWPFLALTSAVWFPAATRSGREWALSRLHCLTTRHRLHRVCTETPLHTRSGRLPLIMRITPTAVGERVVVMTRAGICAADFRAHAEEIAAACFARRVVVTRHPRRSNLVVLEVVRREAHTPAGLSPGFERVYGETGWAPGRPPGRGSGGPPEPDRLPRAA
ncbi:hypothetical protein PS9374_03661 [Planomonospora sphaerica]|uniref:Uncharacterized protein n=1 Tax=Planomonospora sphaerica TaxID=161355 RepID=A0A171DCT0_9ACTN|nr:hypothetical protein [Planomonospora sphaerica]GAT68000.1 hypothetical protein PS9374_03661 [Planomonospora sphaerica]